MFSVHVVWVHFQFNGFPDEFVIYQVLAERSFVACSLIIWSWLMLCSATAVLLVCASRICLMYSSVLICVELPLCPI